MDSTTGYLEIPALGQPVKLGQAYNAITGTLINNILFNPDTIQAATQTIDAPNYQIDTRITESTAERADFLDINASVTANILSGAMQIKGAAAYVDQRNVKEAVTTMAFKISILDRQLRLDLNNEKIRIEGLNAKAEDLKNINATHVVTAITYGGTIVASATEVKSDKTSSNTIKGELSIKVKNAFDLLGSAEGDAKLSLEEKESLNKYDLEIQIMGDTVISDKVPTTISTLVETMAGAKKRLPREKLVPVQIQLTPIAQRFVEVSAVAFFRELEDQALSNLVKFYDELVSLAQSQATLTKEVQTATFEEEILQPSATPQGSGNGGSAPDSNGPSAGVPQVVRSLKSKFFPSLVQRCVQTDRDTQLLIVEVRNNMGRYLREKRENPNAATGDFDALPFIHPLAKVPNMTSNLPADGTTIRQAYNSCKDLLKKNRDDWTNYQIRLENPSNWKYLTASDMLEQMDIGESGTSKLDMLAIVIVPDVYNSYKLSQLYDFKKDIIGQFIGKRIGFYSIYPDILLDDVFELAGMISQESSSSQGAQPNYLIEAIKRARRDSEPVLLFLTRSHDGRGAIQWQIPSEKGWGLIVDTVATTRYIGEIANGKPHGYGRREYYDTSSYAGNWIQGIPSGYGNLLGPSQTPTVLAGAMQVPDSSKGVFMDGKLATDAVPVDIILFDDKGYPKTRVQTALPSPTTLQEDVWEQILDTEAGRWTNRPELVNYFNDQIRRISLAVGGTTDNIANERLANCVIVTAGEEGHYPRFPTSSIPRGFTIICDGNGRFLSYYKPLAMTMDEDKMFDYLGARYSAFRPIYEMQPLRIWRRSVQAQT